MTDIDITTWGHAAVRLDRAGHRLVIDPGLFSAPEVLDGAGAVLITHEHPDHVDPKTLVPALAANEALEVWGPSGVVTALVAAGAPAHRVHEASPGSEILADAYHVNVLGGEHAMIHPSLPPAGNVAYLVEGAILHPGDSLTAGPEGSSLQVLLIPVSGPWLKLAEAVDYMQQVRPVTAVPIHDAVLSDPGKQLTDQVMTLLSGGTEYRRLGAGDVLSVSS